MSTEQEESKKLTPMMQQWQACKNQAKDAVLLFRMGDFYEAFYDDAKTVADALELTLTKRQGIPMSGVPWHAADFYIQRLVSKGYKIAIAEQLEDPKTATGIVKRGIVRFVTPGTLIDSSYVSEKSHNFIVCISKVGACFGIASLDLSTAIFQAIEVDSEKEMLNEVYRLKPSEVLLSKKFPDKNLILLKEVAPHISYEDPWRFEHKTAASYLTAHFKVSHLDSFGLKGMAVAINAAGALLAYIHETLKIPIHPISEIKPLTLQNTLSIDRISQRNLELTEPLLEESRKFTLLSILDYTLTPMGGRLLREWIKKPLVDAEEISLRQDAVHAFISGLSTHLWVIEELKEVRDLERLMMKISSGFAGPRDLVALGNSLEKIASLKTHLKKLDSKLISECVEKLVDTAIVVRTIKEALVEEPPQRTNEGNVFREGFSQELDALREITRGGKKWLSLYQTKIKEETGIKNLKVSYNKIFGYYIEVSKGQAYLMPNTFERRQTLVNSERFVSEELKEYEHKVLTAEDKIQELESVLFHALVEKVSEHQVAIFSIASALARIDVLSSFARIAKKNGYVRPLVDESEKLEIVEGRHPVLEETLGREFFIPNDTYFDGKEKTLMLITGPNMAGKSTYIRQVALLVILAQMGSFIPAKSAHIGIVDQIFTRIGASDNLARGQSTFMVEMSETANILNNLTKRSLVILDEIGRGTSTYDGISIAWSSAEFLIEKKVKTLFATHYWELTELEKHFSCVMNYHAKVEDSKTIAFLHKIAQGAADRSYGIHVAKLAGLPLSVIRRAEILLNKLEARQESHKRIKKEKQASQLTLF